jgi:hypothetical protein
MLHCTWTTDLPSRSKSELLRTWCVRQKLPMHLLQRQVQRPELQPVLLHLRRLLRKGARLSQQLSQGDAVIAIPYSHTSGLSA